MPIIFRVSGHLLKYQMIIKGEEITLNELPDDEDDQSEEEISGE